MISPTAQAPTAGDVASLAARYDAVRAFTMTLCETLSPEDCCLQSMPSASPTRWHLAHTSWFFETFLLKGDPSYRAFDEQYEVLFNSYYNAVGEQFPRARRGLLSRPSLADVKAYREHIDGLVGRWFDSGRIADVAALANIIEWGIQHEQQHQELILTDVKHLFSLNPLFPVFRDSTATTEAGVPSQASDAWHDFEAGVREIGFAGDTFAYDNESPRHRVYLNAFRFANQPVTNAEFLEFIGDGGYTRPELWLSEGWAAVQANSLARPAYWWQRSSQWCEFTLAGLRPLALAAPVCHVSYFEADAFARWRGARLPTEAEWEVAAVDVAIDGNFVDRLIDSSAAIHPAAASAAREASTNSCAATPQKLFGDVWEWTASPYTPYPGYRPPEGALGEYNGKFMCNQYVLRGGSCATPSTHIRATYRNFFPADARWQFSGIRLATDS